MDDSIYNDFRNSELLVTLEEEASVKVLTPTKQEFCEHDFRTRTEYKNGWKYICIHCGVKARC